MKTRRAYLIEPRRFALRDVEVNAGPGEILVKVAVCGLCNWEQNHWKGLLGECPQSLGHEWGGTVAALGADVTDVSHRFPLADVQRAFELCEHKSKDYLKGVVIP